MVQLRDYQKAAILQLKNKFAEGKRKIILCMPTGAGKTVCFAELARRTIEKNKTVMFLTHRKELLHQIHKTYNNDAYIIDAGSPKEIPNDKKCYVAMVETVARRELPRVDLYIIDEVHIGNFKKIIDSIDENKFIVGVTATPFASSVEYEMKDLFEDIVEPTNIKDLQKRGFLAKCLHYVAVLYDSNSKFKVKGGEYTEESQMQAFGNEKVLSGLVELWEKKQMQNKKTIVFCINVKHSKLTCDAFAKKGYKAEHVDGETQQNLRDAIIERFKRGETNILCNVNVLTMGFDCPDIEVVVINRKTKSRTLYMQMVGRGGRITHNKTQFEVLDMGNNFQEHGLWDSEENSNWTRYFNNPELLTKTSKKSSNEKVCPECFFINPSHRKICEKCGFEFASSQKEIDNLSHKNAADAILVNENETKEHFFIETIRAIEATQQKWGYKKIFVWHKVAEYGLLALKIYAKYKKYNPQWVKRNLHLLNDKKIKPLTDKFVWHK